MEPPGLPSKDLANIYKNHYLSAKSNLMDTVIKQLSVLVLIAVGTQWIKRIYVA